MSTVAIRKKSLYTWEHFYDNSPVYVTNVFNINNGGNETFNIVEYRGAKLNSVPIANVTVYDDTGAGTPETFATFSELNTRLGILKYPPFRTGGDGGGVATVQQGDGIEVDSTDADNPIVSIRISTDIGNNVTIGTDGGIYVSASGGSTRIPKTSNYTAVNSEDYANNGTITVTDPTGVANLGYTVLVVSGTTTINSVAYTEGDLVYRFYDGTTWESYLINGGGGGSYKVNQTPDNGAYALLGGLVNGTNAVFTVASGSYISGSLVVYLNGQLLTQGVSNDYVETAPLSGTFTFNTPPLVGDVITAMFNTVASSDIGITVKDDSVEVTPLLSSLNFVGFDVTEAGGEVTVMAKDGEWKSKFGVDEFIDFGSPIAGGTGFWLSSFANSGSAGVLNGASDGVNGLLELATNANASARAIVSGGRFILQNSKIIFQTKISLTALSTSSESYQYRAGLSNSILSTFTLTDGVTFMYDSEGTHPSSTASGNWYAVTANGSVYTFVDTGVAITTNAYITLRIEINSSSTEALFYINNTLVATITTNIPPTSILIISNFLNKTNGTTVNIRNRIDYNWFNQEFINGR